MVPLWMWPMAVACGNTFVLKPSEKVPICAVREVELAAEAGFPPGVLNVVTGGPAVVDHLITHEHVKAVSFVGSTRVARHVYQTASAAGKRAQCMGGAKNYMVIMPDADREAVIDGVLGSAFGNTGQRCLAGSVAIAVGDAAQWFVPALVEAARRITVAPGDDPKSGMGPLIDQASRQRVLAFIECGVEDGATPAPRRKRAASSARRSSTTSRPECASPTKRFLVPCCRSCARRRSTRRSPRSIDHDTATWR
jgi:malonate-semialdehyde dehydrogenase (acetylating)/methylmalonate-semialdehyde dehydrogenase